RRPAGPPSDGSRRRARRVSPEPWPRPPTAGVSADRGRQGKGPATSDGVPAGLAWLPMRTRDLLQLRNTGHAGINAPFANAHSADWDFENDVDWTVPVSPDDPLVGHGWAAYGNTPTFQALPEPVKNHATRRAVGRMLNVLQVGESVAQNVCATLVLRLR